MSEIRWVYVARVVILDARGEQIADINLGSPPIHVCKGSDVVSGDVVTLLRWDSIGGPVAWLGFDGKRLVALGHVKGIVFEEDKPTARLTLAVDWISQPSQERRTP